VADKQPPHKITDIVVGPPPLGAPALGVAVNAKTNRIYVADGGPGGGPVNFVSVIDGQTNTVTALIPGFTGPFGVAVNEQTNRIYVTNGGAGVGSNTVSVIDGQTNTVTATITDPSLTSPTSVAVNDQTNRIYVTNIGTETVSVIDGNTNAVITTIAVGASPEGVAVDPKSNRVYVANSLSDTLSIISGTTNTVIATIPGFNEPIQVAVDPKTNRVYVSNFAEVPIPQTSTLSVMDGATFQIATLQLDTASGVLGGVAVNEQSNRVYVVDDSFNGIVILNGATKKTGATVDTTVAADIGPVFVAANPRTDRVYVSNQGSNDVSVIQD
jgi:YVTN family beta-propeller protein